MITQGGEYRNWAGFNFKSQYGSYSAFVLCLSDLLLLLLKLLHSQSNASQFSFFLLLGFRFKFYT